MAEEYVKTSKEELTAMAINLRENGDFDEGQKFVFPSKYAKPATITYWIYDENETEPWIEKTASQAETLVEGGASILEVEEKPETGESNTVYQVFTYQMGFKEAYEKAIGDFYDKIIWGTLTQDDLEGIVYSKPLHYFGAPGGLQSWQQFPNIKKLTIDNSVLYTNDSFFRLGELEEVEIVNQTSEKRISARFNTCSKLKTFKYKPTALFHGVFDGCSSLEFGQNKLDLSECKYYDSSCLKETPINEIVIAEGCTAIYNYAFQDCINLQSVYLPATPPNLSQYAFIGTHSNLKFYVASSAIKDAYGVATNWSDLISKFEVITS